MLHLLLMLVQAAPPQSVSRSDGDVVVIGDRAEKALAACLARRCSPAKDIEASLQASVEQFSDGRYVDARQTLQKAIVRNKQFAAQMPRRVSSLYATLSTVAEHEGDAGLWRSASRENISILRKYVGAFEATTLNEELQFADDLLRQQARIAGDQAYKRVYDHAIESGHRDIAAGAAFRRAWLAMSLGRDDEAVQLADEAVRVSEADRSAMVELREILTTRIAIRKGDHSAVDRLAARLKPSSEARPALLYAPTVENMNSLRHPLDILPPRRDTAIRFGDVGYWIRPDGRTSDVEVLRNEGLGQWGSAIVTQVRARRYAPLAKSAGTAGMYRIDRFSVRATKSTPTGSHIPERNGALTVHVVDLTETDAMRAERLERTGALQDRNND